MCLFVSQFVFKNQDKTAVRNEMVQLANLLDTVRILATVKVIVKMSPTLTRIRVVLIVTDVYRVM